MARKRGKKTKKSSQSGDWEQSSVFRFKREGEVRLNLHKRLTTPSVTNDNDLHLAFQELF